MDGPMDPLYRESRPILPRNLALLAAAVLIATLIFMVFSRYVMNAAMPSWVIPVTAVIFIIIIVILLVLRLDLAVYGDRVVIRYAFRTFTIEGKDVIDVRWGDLGEIRNYANWNLKGVKHRAFTCIGDEDGVAMKLMGRRVTVVSTSEPDRVASLIPREEVPAEPERVVEDGE